MIWWCGIEKEDDNEKKWEVLRNIQLASYHNGICSSQLVCSTRDESCCIWLKLAAVSHHPVICNSLV
jgi:hypothetical protein